MTDEEFPSRRSLRESHRTEPSAPASGIEQPSNAPSTSAQLSGVADPLSSTADLEGAIPGTTYVFTEPPAPKRRRTGLIVVLVMIVLVGGGALAAWGPVSAFIERFQGPEDYSGTGTGSVNFVITEGETGEDIAHNLVSAGVTKSFDAFYQLCLEQNPTFEPGVFALKQQMSAQAALDALLDPANRLENTVLVTEGQTQADVFTELETVLGVSADELSTLAANPAQFGLPAEATSLEGFLFPATYTFAPGTTATEAISTMVQKCFDVLDAAGVTDEERWNTIVLASLIQKEAGLRDDYYKVSRVFQNRLDPNLWPLGLLQSDATVAYGTGNTHRVSTTDAERADASNPFNTYVHPGMLIAPISNPGELAIDAALHPADGPWLYFVTWNLDTGETIFSSTADEHDAAVAKWLAWMDEHPEYQ